MFIIDSDFNKNLVQKSVTTLYHLPTSIDQLRMHHKEEKTTLAYVRQTLSYTYYPLDSPLP